MSSAAPGMEDGLRWQRIQTLFHEATALPAAEWLAYLQTACEGDAPMMAEVLAMLQEDARGSFLDSNLPNVAHSLLADLPASLSDGKFRQYRIGKLLGEGGAGAVYLASRVDFGSQVAIKILRSGALSPDRRDRFASEQQTLALLDHPYIARILDGDTLEDGTPWFAMEYVEGVDITAYCETHGCSIDKRLRLLRAVCEAVQYAHSHAVIHRDLKPSNILVRADGSVKLLDFGIAKHLADTAEVSRQTRTGQWPMTPAYASPEQVRGERLGTQTDVYSLGVTLYELLTGQLPFDLSYQTPGQAERTVTQEEPVPPSVKRLSGASDTIPRDQRIGKGDWSDLDVLCLTAMHKDAKRRYRSAEALIRDIDHYLKGEPLEGRPDSLRYRFGKFVRRNRRVLSATVAVSAIFIALVVFFVWRLARARNTAVAEATRTQRIERFMLNLFDGGDETVGPAGSLRAEALLDRGVQNARTLNAEPAVQAELYQTLGTMYQKLGKFDQADPLLRSSLERRKSVSGSESHDVAASLVALGLLRLDQGQPAEAERFVREGLALDRRRLPVTDPAVAKDMCALGRVLEERGLYGEAIKILDETAQLQSVNHEITTDLSDTTTALANAHCYLGHLTIADSLYKRALAMDRELFGATHPRVADDYYALGVVQADMGNYHKAEPFYRQALAIKQSWYGKEHPDTAQIMAAVGQSLVYQGRYDEAEPLLQEALAVQERLLGKVHPQVAVTLDILGVLENKRGHLSDAEKDFTRMVDIDRAVYGDKHYLLGIALLDLGEVHLGQKNNARAESEYREALACCFPENLPTGHGGPARAITQTRLGHALVLERRYKEAESHLIAGYEVLIKDPGPQAEHIRNARKDLVTVYEDLNEPDQAKKFKAELAANPAPPTGQSGLALGSGARQ